MKKTSNNVDDLFVYASRKLLEAPKVGNTRELNNVVLVLKNVNNNITTVRDASMAYLFGELLWYFIGDNSLEFISKFSSFWNNISDDGETCNSAYGYLIQKRHGFNQLEKVISILKKDPLSRRAKININFPNELVDTTKDEPCTMSIHFVLRDNKLDCTTIMRSNDIWFGFPYDVAFFTELQKYIARKLNVGYGTYTHFAVSLHMYDRDENRIKKIVYNPVKHKYKFNRELFFEHLEDLYDEASKNGKKALMEKISNLNIYKEVKNED